MKTITATKFIRISGFWCGSSTKIYNVTLFFDLIQVAQSFDVPFIPFSIFFCRISISSILVSSSAAFPAFVATALLWPLLEGNICAYSQVWYSLVVGYWELLLETESADCLLFNPPPSSPLQFISCNIESPAGKQNFIKICLDSSTASAKGADMSHQMVDASYLAFLRPLYKILVCIFFTLGFFIIILQFLIMFRVR